MMSELRLTFKMSQATHSSLVSFWAAQETYFDLIFLPQVFSETSRFCWSRVFHKISFFPQEISFCLPLDTSHQELLSSLEHLLEGHRGAVGVGELPWVSGILVWVLARHCG